MQKKENRLARTALTVLGYEIAFAFVGFVITPALAESAAAIRIPVVGLFIAAFWALAAISGMSRGEREFDMSQKLKKLTDSEGYHATKAEESKRFSRSRVVLAALIAAAPVVIAAVCVAVTAEPYTYTLQGTPSWLGTYMAREEIGAAVAYLQETTVTAVWTDYLRVGVRFLLFPYVSLIGNMTDAAALLFDRISPVLALLLPAFYAAGYQFGPARYAKTRKFIEDAKNKPRKRLKKEAKQRLAGKTSGKKELV